MAHKLKDKAEAAYARGDLFAKRRRPMQDWAAYLSLPPAAVLELPETGRSPAVRRTSPHAQQLTEGAHGQAAAVGDRA